MTELARHIETIPEQLPSYLGSLAVYDEINGGIQDAEQVVAGSELFSTEAHTLRQQLHDRPVGEIEGYISSGSECDVFKITHNNREYAVRMVRNGSVDRVDDYATGMAPGKGNPILEQVVGVSYADGAVVSEFAPGTQLKSMYSADIAAIPDKDFDNLADSLVSASEIGLSIDGSGGNVLYDVESGFKIIDFECNEGQESRGLAYTLASCMFRPTHWLPDGKIPSSEHAEDYTVLQQTLTDLVPTYERWMTAVSNAQKRAGVGEDHFTRQQEMTQQLADMRSALAMLAQEGSVDRLVEAARQSRLNAIAKFKHRLDAEGVPEAVYASLQTQIEIKSQTPPRLFTAMAG